MEAQQLAEKVQATLDRTDRILGSELGMRIDVSHELDLALKRLRRITPKIPPHKPLTIGLAYFADKIAQEFGDTVAADMMIVLAEHHWKLAADEATAT